MSDRIHLTLPQKAGLTSAIRGYARGQAELARQVGVARSELTKIVNGSRGSLRPEVLRGLVTALDLRYEEYFEQYEIPLDDSRIVEIQEALGAQLRQLKEEISVLRGSSFTAFVGFRVLGAVEKVYEGRVSLAPVENGVDRDISAA